MSPVGDFFERRVRDWEPQTLPGILEDLPPMSLPLPYESLEKVTEVLERVHYVDIPDWLEGNPPNVELYTVSIFLDTWQMIIDMARRGLMKQAVLK